MVNLVLALNPCIDAEWRVKDVLWEEKNNVLTERRWAGGKGVNVARWLKHLGDRPLLLVPLGGETGNELSGRLRKEKLPSKIVPLREATRVNVLVTTNSCPDPQCVLPVWLCSARVFTGSRLRG